MKKCKQEKRLEELAFKNDAIINCMERWIELLNQERKIADILYEFGINNVAIYGMGHMGRLLYEQLQKSKVEVSYAIDKAVLTDVSLPVYQSDAELPETDAIIVTAIYYYDSIQKCLAEKNKDIKIISLEDILYWN